MSNCWRCHVNRSLYGNLRNGDPKAGRVGKRDGGFDSTVLINESRRRRHKCRAVATDFNNDAGIQAVYAVLNVRWGILVKRGH